MRRRSLEILEAARREVARERKYYEREARLGAAFLDELERVLDRARALPGSGALVTGDVRGILFERFPFKLLYAVRGRFVVVIAVAHASRRPGYWKRRLSR